jgi:nucleotide-binding universal stress UspA family protein
MSSAHRYTIVVGTDFSVPAGVAIDQALDLLKLRDAELHVVYVHPETWTPSARNGSFVGPGDAETLQKMQINAAEHVARWRAAQPPNGGRSPTVVTHVRHGAAARNIAQLASDVDADLIVVGSHGHGGVERFLLGSVAERVAHLARCPVWIVRTKDHATAAVPEIEPPCPDCLTARAASGGAELWCARHAEHHQRAHGYAYLSDGIYSSTTTDYASTPGQ